ncbi:ATP phosphoribosyltransferase regulatory subunit [Alicyclobacillus contaminans]|uniref:ATP phosphoribosyltransferase regulatory subunit n=1 Tax=Alicyclobacillus contaminans TaxID=392016 RepID=UPI0004226DA7|nr:ATP phosphoribosyltransferase regulatory subunit [Alicyclobacillus contaminans]GMA49666.1 ATP phosphoribosyltransferase regulatory subunit [Alicyclobacillus contaminans]
MTWGLPHGFAEQPAGMRDVYPEQARVRRDTESRLLEFFENHGYQMVSSGAFEYVETLLRGRRAEEADDWMRWFDINGRMVALRPDMTPSIARMAAPLIANGQPEVRWCYAEKVFRRSTAPASLSWASGKAAESTQVGVEWIGPPAGAADVDIIALCQHAMGLFELEDWQMVVSHAQLTETLLAAQGLADDVRERIMDCLLRGDYVGVRQAHVDQAAGDHMLSRFARLTPLRPDSIESLLDPLGVSAAADVEDHSQRLRAMQFARTLWAELTDFAKMLQARGLTHHLSFDFTLTRNLPYYTGIVFEVFVPGVGAPVALGGRYDQLLARFGAPAPAVGFTFEVERLLAALTDGRWLGAETGGKETER